jgi:hypothetical protein
LEVLGIDRRTIRMDSNKYVSMRNLVDRAQVMIIGEPL